MKINNKLWIGVITLMLLAIGGYCAVAINAQSTTKDAPAIMKNDFSANTHVILETSLGNIEIALYNETPQHRDNFIKLVNNGTYNGVLFHRVIKDFMIQTGDPDSKNALTDTFLGAGGPGYDLPAEIVYPKYFHKRGALAAARQGDEVNPERKSSGSQFYIVTGRRFSEYQLNGMIERLANQAKSKIFNSLAQQHAGEISQWQALGDTVSLNNLRDSLIAKTQQIYASSPVKFTPEQIAAYSTVGGTPHLDGQYTVFGEVIAGMDIVDRIQNVTTGTHDRPVDDIKIISARIVK